MRIHLREVTPADLPIFFQHQSDPEACYLAAYPPRDEAAFTAHWTRLLTEATTIVRTILFEGQVAGNVGCFVHGGRPEVGYWIGREYWGKGIATGALAAFLEEVPIRPLYAGVAQHNAASLRVLEKCGFIIVGEEPAFSNVGGERVAGYLLRLDGHGLPDS